MRQEGRLVLLSIFVCFAVTYSGGVLTATNCPVCPKCPACRPPPTCPTAPTCANVCKGKTTSGEYRQTQLNGASFPVYCDATTNGGGWLVFQRRMDGSVDFQRAWADYAFGFGNVSGEFWLGNDYLSTLTACQNYKLRVDMTAFDGTKRWGEWTMFKVASADKLYQLSVGGTFSGDAGDSMAFHNGKKFTTKDKENDDSKEGNCAITYKGAFWYAWCHEANPNGVYVKGGTHKSYADGINWKSFRGYNEGMMKIEMKIKDY